ncbi:MAG TPA: hypothetical protein VMU89_21245 [Thermomicrobiaceae bacterium]|nr:hypothetical protein [Thermomicrobiaceae bacterium]
MQQRPILVVVLLDVGVEVQQGQREQTPMDHEHGDEPSADAAVGESHRTSSVVKAISGGNG